MFTTKFPSYKVNPICIFKCTEYINGRNSCVRNVVIWKKLSIHGKWVGIQKQSPQVETLLVYTAILVVVCILTMGFICLPKDQSNLL